MGTYIHGGHGHPLGPGFSEPYMQQAFLPGILSTPCKKTNGTYFTCCLCSFPSPCLILPLVYIHSPFIYILYGAFSIITNPRKCMYCYLMMECAHL